jgi:hypothetical protein
MNHPMQTTTIQHLFQVTALEDVPRERLESFVEEYPFFAFGHYLLSRKLRAENSDEFTGTTAKTSLYFSNPFWLEWLLVNAPEAAEAAEPVAYGGLVETETSMIEPEERDIWSTREMLVEVEAPAEEPGTETPVAEIEAPLPDAEPAETEAGSVEGYGTESAEVHGKEPAAIEVEETESPALESPALEMQETAPPVGEAQDAVSAEEAMSSTAQQLLNSIEEARLLRESLIKINEDFHTPILPADEPIRDEEPPFVLEEQEQPAVPIEEVPMAEEPATAPLAEVPPSTPIAAPAVTAEPVLTFEPYHTIDYFASQGIRLTLDENPTDQLGKQLKSFTDWLKVMRRLPQREKEIVPDRVAEQAIQSIAAHSIEGKEVLTETMAEVLAMQGMPERARIVYEKLSLLNPGKSAYFAAKIEQLNSH